MKNYIFQNSKAGLAIWLTARSANHAWKRLRRTHGYYFHRDGWVLTNP